MQLGVRIELENPMTQKYLTVLYFFFNSILSVRRTSSWCFGEKVLIQSLYKVNILLDCNLIRFV
jgi:hypothetical protein